MFIAIKIVCPIYLKIWISVDFNFYLTCYGD